MKTSFPRTAGLDHSLSFLADGYLFGSRRFARNGTDVFRARIMGRPVLIAYGADAARIFYEGDRFGRERAMPTSVVRLLQDEGSVQSLAGAEHRHRKSLFVRLLADDDAVSRVGDLAAEEWASASSAWTGPVRLQDELTVILTRVALRWVGLDPTSVDRDVQQLAGELSAMIENAGRFGPPNWAARARRNHTEQWARTVIRRMRNGRLAAPGSILSQFADHRDADGQQLSVEVAAVELINVLRPVVAVARFVVFGVLALHQHPDWRRRVAEDPQDAGHFVNEVRRYYPFFPVVGGRARQDFEWRGRTVETGDWMMLDLYATNHDERIWDEPSRFRPQRFESWNGDQNTLVPQGAGDVDTGHRCPGERATIAIMSALLMAIADDSAWTLPSQDLRISLRRFPALPESGLIIDFARDPSESSPLRSASPRR
ncbi:MULTISPECIES: cytochrome P450 [unclassified Leifsonia]|uniref:cytochrome P450 n=1 Tax=unclassified Leifsonia TaxID=2663824 RepID=UPI0006FFED01|nr:MULTISPECIES: cytochrome P450 [unclassified Leifsonia]KQX06665.1 hypothetical protein ASC59_02080 [Leifsonia sp. Root1293]KRA10949.1 hypothetical protein ASD61_02080 [Leifsonia sp. Root60]